MWSSGRGQPGQKGQQVQGLSLKPALWRGQAGPRVDLGCQVGPLFFLWPRALGAASRPAFSMNGKWFFSPNAVCLLVSAGDGLEE